MTAEQATIDPILHMALVAARAADEKKAENITVLEVGPIVSIYEYLIVASGSNPRQVAAISQEIEDHLALTCDRRPRAVEGRGADRWVLSDYGDIVVHVFHEEERAFYRLERLYGDAPIIDWKAADEPAGESA